MRDVVGGKETLIIYIIIIYIEKCHGAKGPYYFQEMGVTLYEHMLYV